MGTRTASSSARKAKPSFQKSLSRTCLEKIPGAAHSFQVGRVFRIGLDFLTKPAHVNVHTARRDEAIGAPDRIQQLVASENAVRSRGQIIEKAELQGAEDHGFSGMGDAVGRRINGELSNFNSVRHVRWKLGAAQESLHAGNEFA